jgi:hypothetical protein
MQDIHHRMSNKIYPAESLTLNVQAETTVNPYAAVDLMKELRTYVEIGVVEIVNLENVERAKANNRQRVYNLLYGDIEEDLRQLYAMSRTGRNVSSEIKALLERISI